jgi:hypothetical protein
MVVIGYHLLERGIPEKIADSQIFLAQETMTFTAGLHQLKPVYPAR